MYRLIGLTAVLAGGAAIGLAQSGIQWMTDPEQAVAAAQRTKLPLMVYVLAGSSDRDDRTEDRQRKALADPRVLKLAQRFVPLRLSRSRHREILSKFWLPQSANMEMSFVTPAGDKLGDLGAGGVGDATSLADKMSLVFNFYRQQLFDRELRPVLEKQDAKPAELRAALERVRDLTIVGADAAVAALLDREKLDPKVAALTYDVLAHLSTKIGVGKLLERSLKGDARAGETLGRCTPEAAEFMFDQIRSDSGVRLDIYDAVCKICHIKSTKPDKWWEKSKGTAVDKELERVRKIVEAESSRWKKENGHDR